MNGYFKKLHWNNTRICCPSTSCPLNLSLICTFIGCGVVKNYGKYSSAHLPWAFFLVLISVLTFKLAGCRGTEAAVFAADIWRYLKICKLLSNHVIRWKHLLQTPCWDSLTRFLTISMPQDSSCIAYTGRKFRTWLYLKNCTMLYVWTLDLYHHVARFPIPHVTLLSSRFIL